MAKAKAAGIGRNPWIKWYTRDWRSDPPLRMCSFGARGLWADLLSLMWEANVVGFLLVEGVAPTPRDLVGLLGGAERDIRRLIDELGAKNVYSITGQPMPDDVRALVPAGMPDGVMLSRRMVRDKAKADRDRANGKGGGNPQIVGQDNGGDNGPDNPGVNPPPNPQRPESRESSSSSITTDAGREAQRARGARLAPSAARQAMSETLKALAEKKRAT